MYILTRDVDYEGTAILGVFDSYIGASVIRNEVIEKLHPNKVADDVWNGDDKTSTIKYDDVCYTIKTVEKNIKLRDY